MSIEKLRLKVGDKIKYGAFTDFGKFCLPIVFDSEKELEEYMACNDEVDWMDELDKDSDCDHYLKRVMIYKEGKEERYWAGVICQDCNRLLEGIYLSDLDRVNILEGKPYWIENKTGDLHLYRISRTDIVDFGQDYKMLVFAVDEKDAIDMAVECSENFNFKDVEVEEITDTKRGVVDVFQAN